MKKIILTVFTATTIFACNSSCDKPTGDAAQNTASEESTDHVCTADCKPGACSYAHGEKGHVCTSECEKMANNETELSDHVCTADCKPGACSYAHGEKGHTCGENCL